MGQPDVVLQPRRMGRFIHLHARTLPPPLPCLRLRLGGRNRTHRRHPRAYGGRPNGRRQRRIRQYIHDVRRRDDADCIGNFGFRRRNERQDAGGNQLLNNRIDSPKSAKGRLKTQNWFSDDLYARDFQTTFKVV